MDLKATVILKYYKRLLESRKFVEFDILGFLIFIRSFIHKNQKYTLIREFADLVAHRERNQGIVMDCIRNAIANNYLCIKNTNKIQGYTGINENDWKKEWNELGNEFNIIFDDNIIKEITLCIYSLAQKTAYIDKKGHKGIIEFDAISRSGEIALLTTEGQNDSLFICFAKYGKYNIVSDYDSKSIQEVIITYRENGILKVKDISNNVILEV